MKIFELLDVMNDETPVVLLEPSEDLYDVTPNGDLAEAVEGRGYERDPDEYRDRDVQSAAYKPYDSYHSALVIRMEADAA